MTDVAGVRLPFPGILPGLGVEVVCLTPVSGGWLALCRNTDGGKLNVNTVTRYDPGLRPIGSTTVLEAPPPIRNKLSRTIFFDLRIVRVDSKKIVAAGPVYEEGLPFMEHVAQLSWDISTGRFLHQRHLPHNPRIAEKNWLPLPDGGYLRSHGPLVLVDSCGQLLPAKPTVPTMEGFRGSAAPIPYGDGFLYLVHETFTSKAPPLGERRYEHRFVFIENADWDGLQVSSPFTFKGGQWESCFSINEVPGGVLMSCSSMGVDAFTIYVTQETIGQLFKEPQ